ncbi:MAG: hypothetical protein ACK6D7_14365, partial [Acidobacteriota bacterium]
DTNSGQEGLDVLRQLMARYPALRGVVMSALGAVVLAVGGLGHGGRGCGARRSGRCWGGWGARWACPRLCGSTGRRRRCGRFRAGRAGGG